VHSEVSDIGDNPFGMSDFANYSTGQGYSRFDSSALPHFFTPTSEVDVAQSWTSDAQTFSAPTSLSLDTASESTPLSAGQHDSQRTSNTDQVFRSFMSASIMLPTYSVISNPQHASIAESDFTKQSTYFIDILELVYRNTPKLQR